MPSYSRRVDLPGRSAQELFDRVSGDIDRLMGQLPLGKVDVQRDAGACKVVVKTSMATATLRCLEGAMELEAALSLLATPFRSKIDAVIDSWVQEKFNAKFSTKDKV